ncbi:MAG: hypothetical protein K9J21_06995 [Bacteroidales bacterium]|nr:hypothetical protein [Bacteroidales bacterium]
MKADFYNDIKAKIEELGYNAALWLGQIEPSLDSVGETPAIFIEFTKINYTQASGGDQNIDMNIQIHIVERILNVEDSERLFLISQAITNKLYELSIVRTMEIPFNSATNIADWIIEFTPDSLLVDNINRHQTEYTQSKPDLHIE